MTVEDLLPRLEGVRRISRGWIAQCGAHADGSPSLSIRQAEDGRILLHCFAGCSVEAVCHALGWCVADLFPDQARDPRVWREIQRQRGAERRKREQSERKRGLGIDVAREAEQLVLAARGIDISAWSDDALDRALNRLADAYGVLDSERALHERS